VSDEMRCRQCGMVKEDNGFVICGCCYDKNVKYVTECDKLRLVSRHDPGHHRKKDSALISKEYRGRKTRHSLQYMHDTDPVNCDRNTRTEYHGGNYEDE
jgi:hypothetical protein